MKFENTRVMNFEGAFRGMRNPMNSWNKSDSYFGLISPEYTYDYNIADLWMSKNHKDIYIDSDEYDKKVEEYSQWLITNGVLSRSDDGECLEVVLIGPNDMDLAQRLIKAGPEHRKFLRQIFVSVDITAPLYWWKEADTYKVGTTANSTSTMHKLASTPITIDCFETDDFNKQILDYQGLLFIEDNLIPFLEDLRQRYNETKDVRYWKELIRWLPESWLQTRTVTMNYENLHNMYFQRKDHKLNEWSGKHTQVDQSFCQWVKTLPYANDFILY